MRPAKGSLMVLKTKSESGSVSLILRVGGLAVVGEERRLTVPRSTAVGM